MLALRSAIRYHVASRTVRCLGTQRGSEIDEASLTTARQWLAKLDPDTIPHSICDISFSRSSGPGGQNVNKCVLTYGGLQQYFVLANTV